VRSLQTPLASSLPLAQPQHIIVVSNRGPVQFYQRTDGRSLTRQSSGGLATALLSAASQANLTWIAVAGDDADRRAFANNRTHRTVKINSSSIIARYVPVTDQMYRMYYDRVSNQILWFLQHYLFHSDMTPNFSLQDRKAWEEGYVPVNQVVADSIIDEIIQLPEEERQNALVLIQDYHLYLVPGMIRKMLPDIRIAHFTHIPWPAPRYWHFLPHEFLLQIIESMIANDIVGLQTRLDASNFAQTIDYFLPHMQPIQRGSTTLFAFGGHETHIHAYPISIAPDYVNQMAHSREGERTISPLRKFFDRKVIMRVDRVEPSKNIVRGLLAFEMMLDEHPDLIDQVRFMLFLVPSRESVTRYRQYARLVTQHINRINTRFGRTSDPVIVPVHGNNHARALTAMRYSDVMLANSIVDGMHLGAKESAILNENNGVLVISRTAGVYQELKGACLGISPMDVYETSHALYDALTMAPNERRRLAIEAHRRVASHTVTDWLKEQIDDLCEIEHISRRRRRLSQQIAQSISDIADVADKLTPTSADEWSPSYS
jgi:trehalose 6-phosphate synthase